MEDDEILIDGFCGDRTQGYFGLYDGHGGRGTVDFVVKALHMNLEQQLKRHPKQTIPEAYHKSYLSTDGQLRRKNILRSGTTSVSCLIRENKSIGGNGTDGNGGGKGSSNTNGGSRNGTGNSTRTLYTANVGDSRAVLVRNKKAIRLTKDHKASLPEEAKRITEAGGFIGRNRRVNGVLAISRALGDHMLKENDVVTAKPYCITTQLTDEDSFLILACDGVWDVMTDQEAADFVVEKVNNDIKHIDRMKLQPNGSMSNAFGHGDRHNGINLSQSNSNNNNGSKDMQNYTEVEQRKIKMNRILYNTCQALVKEALDRRSLDNVTVMIIKL